VSSFQWGISDKVRFVDLQLVEMMLTRLGMMEDEIFKKRHQDELEFQRRQKELKRRKQIRHQRQV
jgi:5'-3' exonuclease